LKSTKFTDLLGETYIFEFPHYNYGNYHDVVIYHSSYWCAIPIKQVIENSEPWQDIKNKHLKTSPYSIKYIEKFCKNIAFW
jgi:hypothetical protein